MLINYYLFYFYFTDNWNQLKSIFITIQSSRTSFHVSQWKFFHECNLISLSYNFKHTKFVQLWRRWTFLRWTNLLWGRDRQWLCGKWARTSELRRKQHHGWGQQPLSTLTELAKDADNKEDKRDVFGRDVANSLRSLQNKDLQCRVKIFYPNYSFPSKWSRRLQTTYSTSSRVYVQ